MSRQLELFSGEDLPDTPYLDELRQRYEQKAAMALAERVKGVSEIFYDDLFATGVRFPTVTEAFIRQWALNHGQLIGLKRGKRQPKVKQGVRLRLGG